MWAMAGVHQWPVGLAGRLQVIDLHSRARAPADLDRLVHGLDQQFGLASGCG